MVVEATWIPREDVPGLLDAPYHGALRRYLCGDVARHAHVTWIDRPHARPHDLDDDLRDLLVMAAAGAMGESLLVERHAQAAMAAGANPDRVAEALLQLAPYCGFPRLLGALQAVAHTWPDGAPAVPEDIPSDARPSRGGACFDAVYGTSAAGIRANLVSLHPLAQAWIESFAYGRVLAREGLLTLVERELLAVSILTAMGKQDDALWGHMKAAKHLGATPEQIGVAVGAAPLVSNDAREVSALGLLEKL